jgi:uncharacterized protein
VRAVFDTNVVVSALIFGRRLAWLRHTWASGKLTHVVCRETTSELLRVLAYPKFRLDAAERTALLENYLPYAEIMPLPDSLSRLPATCRDRDDLIFLRLSIAAGVPLVTGDADLKVLPEVASVTVLSVAELESRILR